MIDDGIDDLYAEGDVAENYLAFVLLFFSTVGFFLELSDFCSFCTIDSLLHVFSELIYPAHTSWMNGGIIFASKEDQ